MNAADKPLPASIRPIRAADLEEFRACLDRVARERVHIAFTAAPKVQQAQFFLGNMLKRALPFVVAECPIDGIVGWCDIYVETEDELRPGYSHVGRLGMGLDVKFRGLGLGSAMLRVALDLARSTRIERVELQVYASNEPAIALYRKFGFETEGVRRRARKLDGRYDDVVMMARLRPPQMQD